MDRGWMHYFAVLISCERTRFSPLPNSLLILPVKVKRTTNNPAGHILRRSLSLSLSISPHFPPFVSLSLLPDATPADYFPLPSFLLVSDARNLTTIATAGTSPPHQGFKWRASGCEISARKMAILWKDFLSLGPRGSRNLQRPMQRFALESQSCVTGGARFCLGGGRPFPSLPMLPFRRRGSD